MTNKYQYRNAIVDAWQFQGDIQHPLFQVQGDPQVHLRAKDGPVVVHNGDWIVVHANKTYHLVKDEDFKRQYVEFDEELKPADKAVKPLAQPKPGMFEKKPVETKPAETKVTETKPVEPKPEEKGPDAEPPRLGPGE